MEERKDEKIISVLMVGALMTGMITVTGCGGSVPDVLFAGYPDELLSASAGPCLHIYCHRNP